MVWYCYEEMFLTWGNTKSNCFQVSIGVKLGVIISLIHLNVCMDELRINLNNSNIGGDSRGKILKHLCHADDIIPISVFSSGMQRLLKQLCI